MFKKIFLPILIAFLSITILEIKSNAAEIRCQMPEQTQMDFAKKAGSVNLATTSTAANIEGLTGSLYTLTFGSPAKQAYKCMGNLLVSNAGSSDVTLGEGCELEDETVCEDMGIFTQKSANSNAKPKGNLMGMAYSLDKSLKEPLPVNLAYYINQNVKKIPGLENTAFAQDTIEYGGPFLGAIYHYWTISRNVAYAFLAAAMTVIGIMIIMGKSIDPKAGITVQQALPQIIIALILITFSYPIGAAGASLAFNIRGSLDSGTLIKDANSQNPTIQNTVSDWMTYGSSLGPAGAGALALFPPALGLSSGVGALILLLGIVSVIIVLVMYLLVLLKIFGVYLKMLFAIITAPVSFAIGALPGNNDTTMNWFKQYGSYMVSLPAMAFAHAFMVYLTWDISMKALSSFEEFGGWGWGSLAGLAVPAVAIFGFNIVLTIPEKIDGMFGLGGKR